MDDTATQVKKKLLAAQKELERCINESNGDVSLLKNMARLERLLKEVKDIIYGKGCNHNAW